MACDFVVASARRCGRRMTTEVNLPRRVQAAPHQLDCEALSAVRTRGTRSTEP